MKTAPDTADKEIPKLKIYICLPILVFLLTDSILSLLISLFNPKTTSLSNISSLDLTLTSTYLIKNQWNIIVSTDSIIKLILLSKIRNI